MDLGEKVFYVWFDAPIGYFSICIKDFRKKISHLELYVIAKCSQYQILININICMISDQIE